MVREICTRSAGILKVPSELSKVRVTLARPRGARWAPSPEPASPEPAKMTSFMLPPRRLLAPCSPITQASASSTLDLPEPLGPTTALMPGVNSKVVAEAKDLNPRRVSDIRCTRGLSAKESGVCRARSVVRGGIPLVYAVRWAGGVSVHEANGTQSSSLCTILRAG